MYPDQLPPTPLVPVRLGAGPEIWCKLEFLNPSGSTKDRIARYILSKALREGRIKPGGTVVEASSGSTSIASIRCSSISIPSPAFRPDASGNRSSTCSCAHARRWSYSAAKRP